MIFDGVKYIVNLCNRWKKYLFDAKRVSDAKSSNGDIYLFDAECVRQTKPSDGDSMCT